MLSAPNSYGSIEPRCYLDVNKLDNFSTYNDFGTTVKKKFIETRFNKVRLVTFKAKNGKFNDSIDLGDFRYAESKNQSFIF